jgi:hypothetical protein
MCGAAVEWSGTLHWIQKCKLLNRSDLIRNGLFQRNCLPCRRWKVSSHFSNSNCLKGCIGTKQPPSEWFRELSLNRHSKGAFQRRIKSSLAVPNHAVMGWNPERTERMLISGKKMQNQLILTKRYRCIRANSLDLLWADWSPTFISFPSIEPLIQIDRLSLKFLRLSSLSWQLPPMFRRKMSHPTSSK